MGAMHPIIEGFDPDEWAIRDEPTLCRDCDLVHPDTRSHAPYRWRCMAHPADPAGGFLDPDWRPDPPYHECKRVNTAGDCPAWTPRRMPKEATDVQP